LLHLGQLRDKKSLDLHENPSKVSIAYVCFAQIFTWEGTFTIATFNFVVCLGF